MSRPAPGGEAPYSVIELDLSGSGGGTGDLSLAPEVRLDQDAGTVSMEPISVVVRVPCDMTRNHVELNCAGLTIRSASIGNIRGDLVFRCTVNPVPDNLLGTLEEAARSYGTIRLVFPKQPLLLEHVQVKRIEPDSIAIVGRVVEGLSSDDEA